MTITVRPYTRRKPGENADAVRKTTQALQGFVLRQQLIDELERVLPDASREMMDRIRETY